MNYQQPKRNSFRDKLKAEDAEHGTIYLETIIKRGGPLALLMELTDDNGKGGDPESYQMAA